MITFVDELNVIAPNSGKNLVADGGAKNLAFFDMANPRGVNYV